MAAQAPFGFIGIGIMGNGMAGCLLKGGRSLVVWNRDGAKCTPLAEAFPEQVTVVATPQEVVAACPITFSMLSTLEASEAVFPAVLEAVGAGKAIVDCATLTPERMQEMGNAVEAAGGRFLEGPVSGSKVPAETGQLIFLCGGDKGLFDEVAGELELMGKASFHFGATGAGSRMKLVVNMIMGTYMAGLAEGAALADASGLDKAQLMQVLELGVMSSPLIKLKGGACVNKAYPTHFPLKHAQKDMRFALALGDQVGQTLPIAAAANENYKRARKTHADADFSAVMESF